MNIYKCPQCKTEHTSQQWNDRTKLEYPENIELTLIESETEMTCFYCPSCNEESEFGYEDYYIVNINTPEEIEYITIPKSEYDELIETKWKYVDLCDEE